MRFLPVDALNPGMLLGKDIISNSHAYILRRGVTLTADYIRYLKNKGYLGAYVSDEASINIVPSDPISIKTLADGIDAVEQSDIDSILDSSQRIVAEVSSLKELSIDIVDLRSFDDYTYHHSVNVAVYAVAVGKYMGLSDSELVQLCQAGICHDLGKRNISKSIINKAGRLTDEEYKEIKNHPQYSYDILYENKEISSVVRQAVIYHHENENGSGYPFGKEGNQIPLMAKILHGVDVYDALTSKRPYKEPYSPIDAFDYLIGGKDVMFNSAVVDAMRQVIPTYPIGMEVCLSTGEVAIVISHSKDPLRPVVRNKETHEIIALMDEAYEDVSIVASGFISVDYSGAVKNLNEKRQSVKIQKPKILIVDDSALSLHQLKAALSEDIYKILTMQSGVEVLNYISKKGPPDLIIMDIEMPMLNGITTATRIREMGYNDLPIIFLSGRADKESVMQCRAVNAKDYIIKPVRPTYLVERVAYALGEQQDR